MSRSWMDHNFLWSLALAENSHRFACLRLASEKAVVGRVPSTLTLTHSCILHCSVLGEYSGFERQLENIERTLFRDAMAI